MPSNDPFLSLISELSLGDFAIYADNSPRSSFVTANGIQHHVLQWGDPKGQPLLMLHGIGLCAQVWNWTARRLAKDYCVLSIDLRGHGDSEKPGCGYTFHDIGIDLAELVSALGLVRPLVVGHSAGGSAAIIANSLVPGALGPTVVIDSRVGGSRALSSSPDMRDRPARTRRKHSVWASRQKMYEAYRNRRVFKAWKEEIFRDYIEGGTRLLPNGQAELKCPLEVEATFYEQRAILNTSPYVTGMTGQFLLLLGNYPGAQTWKDPGIQEFLKGVQGTQVRIAPEGSHFLPMEHPEFVLAEIQQFFRRFRDSAR